MVYRRLLGQTAATSISGILRASARKFKRIAAGIYRRISGRRAGPQSLPDAEIARTVATAYRHFLGRAADAEGLAHWTARFRNGMTVGEFLDLVHDCNEARARRQAEPAPPASAPVPQATQPSLPARTDSQPEPVWPDFSDGELVMAVYERFHHRGVLPEELERWKQFLQGDLGRRDEFIKIHLSVLMKEAKDKADGTYVYYDPSMIRIMGTKTFITKPIWEARAREALAAPIATKSRAPESPGPFRHSGEYVVSAIASMYRGGKYIERFLENICSQTLFDRSELIIIDADSPENEFEVIEKFQRRYPNIVYRRMDLRIGIYEAWNAGLKLARGRYITNVNLDDLRSANSFQLQAETLDRHRFADVVYQDFYYAMDPDLTFEEIAACGFKSDLPIVTPNNLLPSNSPHNAPMWRAALHEELGPFDTSFRSAGDHEFWVRCACKGKVFFKINEPHIAYYINPKGISTRPDTRGVEEGQRIWRMYNRAAMPAELYATSEVFRKRIGPHADPSSSHAYSTYYDIAQKALLRLGAASQAARPNFRKAPSRIVAKP